MKKIEKIACLLENPPAVLDILKNEKPVVHHTTADVSESLQEVTKYNYSQYLVRDENRDLTLVTTNAVARWSAAEYVETDGALMKSTTLSTIIRHVEKEDSLIVRPRSLTVVDAWRLFAGLEKEPSPMAIALTNSGAAKEKPLLLRSRADVPVMVRILL